MDVLFAFDFKKGNKNNHSGNSTKIIPFIITFADDLLLFGVFFWQNDVFLYPMLPQAPTERVPREVLAAPI